MNYPATFPRFSRRVTAFTLIEVLVSVTILAMIMLIVTTVLGQAQRSWRAASSRVSQFREARQAFDTLTRGLRQATLPAHFDWGYGPGGANDIPTLPTEAPTALKRKASLGFNLNRASAIVQPGANQDVFPGHAVVFQAPMGSSITTDGSRNLIFDQLDRLLCVRGYFVKFSSNAAFVPRGLASRLEPSRRYRLFEYRPPTEYNSVFATPPPNGVPADGATAPQGDWMRIDVSKMDTIGAGGAGNGSPGEFIRPVAENIMFMAFAVSFSPEAGSSVTASSLATPATSSSTNGVDYFSAYESYTGTASGGRTGSAPGANRLPRSMEIIMIAIDEESATRLADTYGGSPPSLVQKSGASFDQPANYTRDIARVRKTLEQEKVNFRIFNSIILLPASDT